MRRHEDHSGVQEYGCALALSVMSGNDELIEKLVVAGGIERIVTAMRLHPRHTGIQEQGCGAVWNFLSSRHHKNNKAMFEENGGIDCLVAAMENFQHDPNVQEQACGAVWNFLSGKSSRQKAAFTEAGGMECLVGAMKFHCDHERVQEYACGAALRLMAGNERSVTTFTECGGIQAAIGAMVLHNDCAPVLLQALGVAWHFMRDTKDLCTTVISESQALTLDSPEEAGIECMIHPDGKKALDPEESKDDVTGNKIVVSVCNDRREAFATAGGMNCIIHAMQRHGLEDADVLEQCFRAGIHFFSDSPDLKVAFARADGVQCIVDGMQKFAEDKMIQELGCEALLSLSIVDGIFQGLDACDVLSVLQAAKSRFQSSQEKA